MSTFQFEDVRATWLNEQEQYRDIGQKINDDILVLLKNNGVSAKVSFRVKETDSLIKKIARKGSSYDAIHDKVGVRVITYFKEQLFDIDELFVRSLGFEIVKREDMSEKLGENVFGYQSIHYDLKIKENGQERFCELQLRTICQDNWSELSHALAYKTEIAIPQHIKRELNALSAVFELADNQFQLIQSMIEKLPDTNPIRVLNHVEKYFYTYLGDFYDKEMTSYFLKGIAFLYGSENPILLIEQFAKTYHESILSKVYENHENIFISQPEILVIFERLQNSKYSLINYWDDIYPHDELESIANIWGTSIE